MDIYKFATQNALRFPSKKGELTAENLFDLPLTSQSGFDLNSVAKAISAQLKGAAEETFVDNVDDDPRKKRLTAMLDLVKDVIATKQAANRAAAEKRDRDATRTKLLDLINTKKDAKLAETPVEELEKQLAELG